MDELFLRLHFPKRAQRVNWTNSSIILCPKSGHEPFKVCIYSHGARKAMKRRATQVFLQMALFRRNRCHSTTRGRARLPVPQSHPPCQEEDAGEGTRCPKTCYAVQPTG